MIGISARARAKLAEWAAQHDRYLAAMIVEDDHNAGCALAARRILAQQACRLMWADANQPTEETTP